jgi:hypothetical protein
MMYRRRHQFLGHRPFEQSLDPPHTAVDDAPREVGFDQVLADGLELFRAKLPSRGVAVELSEWA